MNKGWIFPYEDIPRNSRIIIYGAGSVGKSFYEQIIATNYSKVILWVDAQFEYYRSIGMNVSDPLSIKEYEFDYILIAVDSPDTSRAIYSFLEKNNVIKSKIWSSYQLDKSFSEKSREIIMSKYDRTYLDIMPNISNLRIAFIIPPPIKGGGGHRNIFRVAKRLADSGHDVDIYCINSSFLEEENKSNVCEWFYDLSEVKFINYSDELGVYDVGIATWWETVYVIKKHESHFRNIFCFTQDYEPFFYPLSSNYIMAENTYKFGYKYICSGPWCERILKEKYNADAVSFQFPLDREIYNETYKRKKQNRNIVFFAKPEMPRRCFEIGINALASFHEKMPDVEIVLFGSKVLSKNQVPFQATIRNIVPTLQELAQMYTDADLGIVFSVTNPSLVPYEMMSCGCPVVDLDVEYALSKYGNDENNVFLLDALPDKFSDELVKILENTEVLKNKADHALRWVKEEFPSENEMENIVESIIMTDVKNKLEISK